MSTAPPVTDAELGEGEFAALAEIVHRTARIQMPASKMTLVRSRLQRRLRATGLTSYADYVRRVRGDAAERAEMIDALTTNHTHFFRENHHFDHLREVVRPRLMEKAAAGGSVRLWSAGCSSGEEVYSMAMTLAGSHKGEARWLWDGDVRLLASDISPTMVAAVEAGRYAAEAVEGIPDAHRCWVGVDEGRMAIDPRLVGLVAARQLNLFAEWPMARPFDVIFCRNVMIYFDEPAKRQLEQRLVAQLVPGGTLYIGHSERLGGAAQAATRSVGQTIYVRGEGV